MEVTADLQDWLILLHAPGVGPRNYAHLLAQFATPHAARRASRSALQALGYTATEAYMAMRDADRTDGMTVEERVLAALRRMGQSG